MNDDLANLRYEIDGDSLKVSATTDFSKHLLKKHSLATEYENVPTGFDELRLWLEAQQIEGIVWHHPDGRMVKIKKKDFGFRR